MQTADQPPSTESPAQIYERHMMPAIFAPWVPALLDAVALAPHERLLDVACGTGVVARGSLARARAGGRVAGLDINPQMLAMARAKAPGGRWVRGNGMALPFAASTFDVVVCQQGLQFFPDRSAALHEIHRVLGPGGRLALAVWCSLESSPGHFALAQGLQHHVGPEAAALMVAAFRPGTADTIRRQLEEAGFRDIHIHQEERLARFPSPEAFTRWVVQGSVLGRTGVTVSNESLLALIAEVSQALQPYVQAEGLAFPMQAYLTVAHRIG